MRICSDFFEASRLFNEAEAILRAQPSHSLEWARIEVLKAHLFADCQQFEQARRSLECALEIYRDKNRPHMEGRTMIALGSMLGRSGRPELAVDLLRKGLVLTDSKREPRLTLVVKHNLVHYLFDSGQHLEAAQLLPETRALHEKLGNAVDVARLTWLEGQIALEQGDLKNAEAAFDKVRDFFIDKGVPLDTAWVSLDLATIYLKQNRLAELKSLSVEMLTIFEGIGAQKECQAALSFFERAIELDRARMEMVCDLLEQVNAVRLEEKLAARLSVST
jgi:tetratricopeptide (TPR) repeat protein